MVEFAVSYNGVDPNNSFVGTIYKSSENAYMLKLEFDQEPMQIFAHYRKGDGSVNENGMLATVEFLLDEDMTNCEGELAIVFELKYLQQRMFTKPIYLEIRE